MYSDIKPMLMRLWMPRCRAGVTSFMDDFGNTVLSYDHLKVRYILKGF